MLKVFSITNTISELRKYYVYNNEAISYFEINNGLCENFASDVIDKLGGETKELFLVFGENFMIGFNDEEYENDIWDINLLSTHWEKVVPLYGLTWDEVNKISFGNHAWIVFQKRHYDAECPEGVDNFFELPIFQRYIEHYIKNK